MPRLTTIALLGAFALTACNQSQPQQNAAGEPGIQVRSKEQDQLKQLDQLNLAIGLKRAIYDSGYSCRRVTDAGFAGTYKNLDMWVAHCADGKTSRDWAIFAGPDGSAQVRDCRDVAKVGLPRCEIKSRPKAPAPKG